MKFSIIIPSFNQDQFIADTFENVKQLKIRAAEFGIDIEILIFDSCSNEKVLEKINIYKNIFDFIEIKKDRGQYDAINKGIKKISGEYWTWLNTDDLINIDGFLKIAEILNADPTIDYIFGNINHISESGGFIKEIPAVNLTIDHLVNVNPGIFQPGSFFKKSFTDKIGLLEPYSCCFDYEYILRILTKNGIIVKCNFAVAEFRLHKGSKTGSVIPVFIREQMIISKKYGRKLFSWHLLIAKLRLLKHNYFKKFQ
jgi:glycosyltransferase involved in cell wall biosynthesis